MNAEKLRRSGNPAAAIDLCRDALARFPGHLSARVTLGWALLDLGRLGEAREEFQIVRQSAPDNFAAIRGLAQLHVLEENDPSYAGDMDAAAPEPPSPAAAPPPSAPKLAVVPVAPVEPVVPAVHVVLVAPVEPVAAVAPPQPPSVVPEPVSVPVAASVAPLAPVAVLAPPMSQPVRAPEVPSRSAVVMRLESWLLRVEALRAAV